MAFPVHYHQVFNVGTEVGTMNVNHRLKLIAAKVRSAEPGRHQDGNGLMLNVKPSGSREMDQLPCILQAGRLRRFSPSKVLPYGNRIYGTLSLLEDFSRLPAFGSIYAGLGKRDEALRMPVR